MRRLGDVFDTAASASNLWQAWREFRRGKRNRPSVQAFELGVDRRLVGLRRELAAIRYEPGGYRSFLIHEPKRRLIAAASVRDRVVHHAVHRVLAPQLDRRLLPTTYTCLPGRGSHRAVLAFLAALRRYRHALPLDMRSYFLSIHRGILIDEVMARRLKDRRLLELLRTIAASGAGLYRHPWVGPALGLEPDFPPADCGLPIGNLTSQWWGNHYLDGLDHFVKRTLKIPHYQRYMDDVTLFADDRGRLAEARDAVAEWLWEERRLRLKKPRAEPRSTRGSFTYLGYRVSRAGARSPRSTLRRMEQRLGELILRGDPESIERSLASYRGVVGFVDVRS